MAKNNTVYLLVGTRGAGKTTYARELFAADQSLQVVSRDEILVRLFGSEYCDPYSGGIEWGMHVMHRLVRRKLSTRTNLRLILDCYTGSSDDRKSWIENLRRHGADRVVALYFVTPVRLVSEWFWKKPGIAKMSEMSSKQGMDLTFFSEDAPRLDYEIFHKYASEIDSDGFDEVVRVDPTKPLVALR